MNRNNNLENNKFIYFEETDGENNITIFNDRTIEYGFNSENNIKIKTKIYYKYILSNSNCKYIPKAYLKVNNGETIEDINIDNFKSDFDNLKQNSKSIEYEFLQNSNTKNKSIKIIFYNNNNENIMTLETDLL